MIYKILIKGANGTMNYATMRKEIVEKVIENDEIVEKPTGKYKVVDFETTDKNEVKEKYIALLDQYKKDALDVVADMKEIVTITVDIQDADETASEGEEQEEPTTPPTTEPGGVQEPEETIPPVDNTEDNSEEGSVQE